MKRMAWTACVLVVSSLGVSGMLAGGCGGDDEAPATPGTGGSGGGSAGSGASGTKAGSAGTGGGASGASGASGGSGTAVNTDSGSDAPVACMPAKTTPTAMEKAICTGGLIGDSAASCLTTCFCNACPKEAVACLGDPKCKAIVDCAAEKGCASDVECIKPEKCQTVIATNITALPLAQAFACCGGTCQVMCPSGEGGTPEGGGDAASDAPKSDASAADAPASDATTSDAPADAASAADADNEGG